METSGATTRIVNDQRVGLPVPGQDAVFSAQHLVAQQVPGEVEVEAGSRKVLARRRNLHASLTWDASEVGNATCAAVVAPL